MKLRKQIFFLFELNASKGAPFWQAFYSLVLQTLPKNTWAFLVLNINIFLSLSLSAIEPLI